MIDLFDGDWRYRVGYGGRGSIKSWTFARMLILAAINEENPAGVSYLCCRELSKSIKDSVHKLLLNQIEMMGLGDYFSSGKKYLRSKSGIEFLFYGLRHNAEEIKSIENVKIAWLEEAQGTSANSLKVLLPTIRMPGSEIWVSFNPDLESNPIYQMFIVNTPPNAKVVKVNFSDNPWLSEELETQRLHMQRTDPDAYNHVWLGNFLTRTDAQVLGGKWIIDIFEPGTEEEGWYGPYYGADWGFSQDPTVLVKVWLRIWTDESGVDRRNLYIEEEVLAIRCENDDIAELFDNVEGARKHIIRADNARPETISHVNTFGYNVVGVDKWPGSVEEGIAYMRSFDQIVVHDRCKHTAEECRLYTHKIDRLTEDILRDIVDKNNHCMDAIRYSLSLMIKKWVDSMTDKVEKEITRAEKKTIAPTMEDQSW